MELRTAEVPVTFHKDREGRVSHHKRSGWFSPWAAAWINLRAMFVYGSDFFVFKPGLVLMVLGLLLTLPLSFGDLDLGADHPLAELAVPRRRAARPSGFQAFFLGCIAQVLFDYTGRHRRRWLRIFPYTRTVLIAFGLVVLGIALAIPLVVSYLSNDLALQRADTLQNHLAVTGLPRSSSGPSSSSSRSCCTERSWRRPMAAHVFQLASRLGRVVPPVLRPSRAPGRLLDRQGRRASVRPQPGVRSGAHEMAFPISTYAPWQSDPEFQAVYDAIRRNTLVDVWRCHELWSLLGELREVPGAILEVGVWRGGTGALMAARAAALGLDEPVYLCDTWHGVVKTGEVDIYYRDGKHDDTSREIVEQLIARMGLENVELLEGIFPEDTG